MRLHLFVLIHHHDPPRIQVAFVAVKDMFTGSITDVCWSNDGLRLAMSSQDGSVAIVEFSEAEIGRPIPDASFFSIIERAYGAEAAQKFAANRSRARQLCQQNFESKTLSFTSGTEAQKETVDAKGRRRITPVSLTGAGFGQGSEGLGVAPSAQKQQAQQRSQPASTLLDSSAAPAQPAPMQIKRKSDGTDIAGAAASKRLTTSHHHHHQRQQQQQLQQQQGSGNESHSSSHADNTFASTAAASSLQSRLGTSGFATTAAEASRPIQITSALAPAPAVAAGGYVLDAVEYTSSTRLQDCGATPTVITFIKATASAPAAATLSRGSNVLWRQSLPATPSCCSGVDLGFSVILCSDASMHAFAADGERMALPMRVESPVARVMTRVHLSSFYVMVLSCSGRFKVWDIKLQRCICCGDIDAFASAHRLNRNLDVQLLPTGIPAVIAGSSAWAYHAPMQSWLCVCDASSTAMQLHTVPPPQVPSILESIELACGQPLPAPPPVSLSPAVTDYLQLMLQRLQVRCITRPQTLPIPTF